MNSSGLHTCFRRLQAGKCEQSSAHDVYLFGVPSETGTFHFVERPFLSRYLLFTEELSTLYANQLTFSHVCLLIA